MRMAQNEMPTVDNEERRVLCVRMKNISYVNMMLYLVLFTAFSHLTFRGKAGVNSTEFFIGLGLMLWTLAMCIAASIMHIGRAVQRADYIFPFVVMTVATCFIFIAYMFYMNNQFMTILLTWCLIYIFWTWYPMFELYKQILLKSANASAPEPSAPMEDQPLNHTVDLGYGFRPLPNVVQDFRKAVPPFTALDNCQSPPSYESAMGVDH